MDAGYKEGSNSLFGDLPPGKPGSPNALLLYAMLELLGVATDHFSLSVSLFFLAESI